MDTSSNTLQFATLTGTYPATKLASGLTINTTTLIATGGAHGSVATDILFRNTDASNTRNLDVIICPTGSQATAEYNAVQITIPANAGNNGSVSLASLAALAPSLFGLDLAGNRFIALESSYSIYVINKAALTADLYCRVNLKSY
jgi:hypothetical protein